MMSLKNELIGIWTLRGSDYSGHPILLPVQIPCYVHPTLEKEHILPEMFWRKNAEQCQWVEEHTWEFCCVFDKPAFLHPDNAVLEFGGVDTFAEYTLNDTLLGASQNMFVSCSFRVEHLLKEKDNVLRVVIRPWREVVGDKPIGSAAFTGERVHVRRMQCTFFWDWVERFVSAGIWQPVYLYNDIHWHSFYELELVLDGCVYENINGYECTLTRGMLTLLSPYDFHKIDTRSINEVSILKIGFCEEELSEEIRQLLRNARIPFLLKLNEDMISEFRKQLHTIQEMIKSNHAYQLYVIRRYVELLLLDILGKMAADPSIIISEMETCTDTQVNSIRAVLLHIDSHYAEPIRRDEIAENLHYSPNYLSTLFRQMTGYTISDYVNDT